MILAAQPGLAEWPGPCEQRATLSDKEGKANKSWHENQVADRGFHSWYHYNLVHTLVLISRASDISSSNFAKEEHWNNSCCEKIGEVTQLGMSLFSLTKATLLICICRRQNCWTKSQLDLHVSHCEFFWNALNVNQKLEGILHIISKEGK